MKRQVIERTHITRRAIERMVAVIPRVIAVPIAIVAEAVVANRDGHGLAIRMGILPSCSAG